MKPPSGMRVVLWSDEANEWAPIEKALARLGCRLEVAASTGQVVRLIKSHLADLIVARLRQGWHQPLELLAWMKGVKAPPPVLVVSSDLDVSLYLEAMERGAFDCVGLPLNENELCRIVSEALEPRRLEISAA